jgi:hypothetical protein
MKPVSVRDGKERRTVLVDARTSVLPFDVQGPFVRLADGAVLAVAGRRVLVGRDGGRTWDESDLPLPDDRRWSPGRENALLRTKAGTVVLVFHNEAEEQGRKWTDGEPPPNAQLPVYVMRSGDDGRTWQPPQRVHDGWTRDSRSLIQLRSGRLVLATSRSVPDPGRQQALCLLSDDDGRTWRKSGPIDLGDFANPRPGRGDGHDGAHRGTLVELADGRLWMLLSCRKGLGQAFSRDGGATWTDCGPSDLPSAGFSPATLARLKSGRLLRCWTPRVAPDDPFPRALAARLAVAFSDDDGRTWSPPAILVHDRPAPGTDPHAQWRRHVVRLAEVFEPDAGELWIATHRPAVRIRVVEKDFVPAKDRP